MDGINSWWRQWYCDKHEDSNREINHQSWRRWQWQDANHEVSDTNNQSQTQWHKPPTWRLSDINHQSWSSWHPFANCRLWQFMKQLSVHSFLIQFTAQEDSRTFACHKIFTIYEALITPIYILYQFLMWSGQCNQGSWITAKLCAESLYAVKFMADCNTWQPTDNNHTKLKPRVMYCKSTVPKNARVKICLTTCSSTTLLERGKTRFYKEY